MRGVYSMAALAELERQGLSNAFDVVIGSSAGAINAAYFLAGQAQEAVGIYTDSISNLSFINPLRLWRIIDVDYLINNALRQKLPLDVATLAASPGQLRVVVTNALTAEPETIHVDSSHDIYEVFRATAALPGLYNRRVTLDGTHYVDGGLSDAIPLEAAYADASLVLATLTRRPNYRQRPPARPVQVVTRALLRNHSPAIRDIVSKEYVRLNHALEILENGPAPEGTTLHVLWPTSERRLVSRATINRKALLDCAALATSDMQAVLSRPVSQL